MIEKMAQGSAETITNWTKDVNKFENRLTTEKRYGTMVDGTQDKNEFIAVRNKVEMADLIHSKSLHD